jgi:hypothetical protein
MALFVKFQDIPIMGIRYSFTWEIILERLGSSFEVLRVKTVSHWHSRYQVIDGSDHIRLTTRMKAK